VIPGGQFWQSDHDIKCAKTNPDNVHIFSFSSLFAVVLYQAVLKYFLDALSLVRKQILGKIKIPRILFHHKIV
jgi:hypothetical protein